MEKKKNAVTGALGYSGKYITQRLLDQGHEVISLTNSQHRSNPFGERISLFPLCFDSPDKLARSLENVSVLYNTYWVRFNHKKFSHADAVKNTLILFKAAKKAGVERLVHISITNPSEDSPLEYFRGKARLENELKNLGISYAILRPAVLFGKEDILINNIAWILRRFPVFGVFGKGSYKIQPIYVDDLARLAVDQGDLRENTTINAIGPETFTFRELVQIIGKIIGKKRPIISVSPGFGYMLSCLIGLMLRDVFVTREEIKGLMAGLLHVDSPPVGKTKFTDWAQKNMRSLGQNYASELARRK